MAEVVKFVAAALRVPGENAAASLEKQGLGAACIAIAKQASSGRQIFGATPAQQAQVSQE
jgi:hypothetical protein